MIRKIFNIGFLFFFCLHSWLWAEVNQSVLIRLPEKATVVGPELALGQVAEVIGENKMVLEKVRRLSLGRAALAGNVLKVTPGFIKIKLRQEGYSLKDFSFEGVETTEVLTQSVQMSTADLLPEVKAFVLKELRESPENVEVRLAGPEKKMMLPAGDLKTTFRPPLSGKFEGTLLLTSELEVDGRLAKVLPLRVVVEVYHPVVVAQKGVEKGDKFTRENVALVRKPTSALLSGSIDQLSSVLGRTAGAPLAPGTVLRMTQIYDPPVVKHGDLLEAVVRRGNVEITVQVRAVEDGKAGDRIRVENTESHKVLAGKVLDEKTVLVEQGEP